MKVAGRILAIASGGGHWVEMCRLLPAFEGLDVAFASVYSDYKDAVPGRRFYSFPDFSRFHKSRIFVLLFRFIKILIRERPVVVITTGSAPALIMLALAKVLLRSKTVWIDSIANCEQLSSSGKLAGYVADVWLTQWEHLATPKGPQHWGAVL